MCLAARVATLGARAGWVVGMIAASVMAGGCESGSDRSTDSTPAQATSPPASSNHSAAKPGVPKPKHNSTSARSVAPGSALSALDSLRVKGRSPMTGYDRNRFGQAWLDANRNGCDTRNDILARDLDHPRFQPGTGGCVVLTGSLQDPYLGGRIHFERGADDIVDIDHVVALGNAWATGAARWDIHRRAALANDPLNLLAVDEHTNRSKSDGDAATWLPPNKAFRCAYVARQVAVKVKYHLWVTAAEKAAITRVLRNCPDRRLPVDRSRAPTRVDQNIVDPGPPRQSATTSPGVPRGLLGGSVYYPNCTAVRAAGAAPIRRGQPGYSSKLDRDGDGVACE